jgi:hypothetical protein
MSTESLNKKFWCNEDGVSLLKRCLDISDPFYLASHVRNLSSSDKLTVIRDKLEQFLEYELHSLEE